MQRSERLKAHEVPQYVSAGGVVTTVVERRERHVGHLATHLLLLDVASFQHLVPHVKCLITEGHIEKSIEV